MVYINLIILKYIIIIKKNYGFNKNKKRVDYFFVRVVNIGMFDLIIILKWI